MCTLPCWTNYALLECGTQTIIAVLYVINLPTQYALHIEYEGL